MELEGQVGGRVGIGLLLVRQAYVVADRQGACIGGAAVGGFHDAGPAAGCNHVVVQATVANQGAASFRGHAAEGMGLFITSTSGLDPGRTEDHDGGADASQAQHLFCLGVFEEKAHAAHRVAQKEVGVERRQAVAWLQ